MKKRTFEIWATFPSGKEVKVETHKSERSAQSAIGAMNAHNLNDLKTGGGFPHGVPTYEIKIR